MAEVGRDGEWFCWLRSDASHRYHRFIHIRHLRSQRDVTRMIEALTGQTFNPSPSLYGMLHAERDRERLTQDRDRLDRLLREREPP